MEHFQLWGERIGFDKSFCIVDCFDALYSQNSFLFLFLLKGILETILVQCLPFADEDIKGQRG